MSNDHPPPGGQEPPFEEPDEAPGPRVPPPPPPPAYGQVPPAYGQVPPTTPYGAGWAMPHSGATTSLVLGIASIAVAVIGTCLCFFLGALAALVGPFGIWQALRARAEIDAQPGRYDNRGHAVAGLVCSIVGTALGALLLVATAVLFAVLGVSSLNDMST